MLEVPKIRNISFLVMFLALAVPAWAGHTLTIQEKKVLESWIGRHPEYRIATDDDCDCANDIKQMKAGSGGLWKPVPDYHPYVVTGDFNGDGIEDFAVVVIERSKQKNSFELLIFNGPLKSGALPAFTESGLDLKHQGLFYGPPRPKPYRLLLGRFESDSGSLLLPSGHSYKWSN